MLPVGTSIPSLAIAEDFSSILRQEISTTTAAIGYINTSIARSGKAILTRKTGANI